MCQPSPPGHARGERAARPNQFSDDAGTIAVIVALAAGGQQDAPLSPGCPVPAWSITLNQRIAADQAAAGPHAPTATAEADGVKLCPASFDFHASSRSSLGRSAVEEVASNCTARHSVGTILEQPALFKAEWTVRATR